MKKNLLYFFCGLIAFLLSENIYAGSVGTLSITGAVKQPLNLTIEDLKTCQSIRVQLNEITKNGNFKGVFYYQGVPLKSLLELSLIDKGKTDFSKSVDLAILIKNKEGGQAVLSWGEVFYRNPGQVIIAFSSQPIMPHKACKNCHSPDVYKPWLSQFGRKVGFPKLVVSSDIYSDRSMEEITEIRVVDLKPEITVKKSEELYSSEFTIKDTQGRVKPVVIKKISDYPLKEITVKVVGEGKGYHGTRKFQGAPLIKLFEDAKIKADINTAFLVSAPDGYRSLLSSGEVFLSPAGGRIIIADKANGQSIKKGGKFCLILPDDLMADRWVKAVKKIEIISFTGNIYGLSHK